MTQQQKDEVMFNLIKEMLRQQSDEERLAKAKKLKKSSPILARVAVKLKSFFQVLPTDRY